MPGEEDKMSISDVLLLKFPGLNLIKDVVLVDEGKGPYIKGWNLPSPMPTKEELAQWEIELDLEYRQKKAREKREYPPISDQLDMMYRDTQEGTSIWQNTIAAIKASQPIPSE